MFATEKQILKMLKKLNNQTPVKKKKMDPFRAAEAASIDSVVGDGDTFREMKKLPFKE